MAKFKVGDKFIFNKCSKNKQLIEDMGELKCFHIGKIYTLYENYDQLRFKDSENDERDLDLNKSLGYKLTKIID